MDPTLVPFVAKMVYYAVMAVVLIAVLNRLGVATTSVVAIFGAAGLAVGLAMQGTLSNFASGVMLLIFRPFDLGDYVDAGGITGTVMEIGIFSTTLKSPDNIRDHGAQLADLRIDDLQLQRLRDPTRRYGHGHLL